MKNGSQSSPPPHRIVVTSASHGGNSSELEQLRKVAGYDPDSKTWGSFLKTPLDQDDVEKLQQLFNASSTFGSRVSIETAERAVIDRPA
jgi:hypothetical protein